MKALCVLCGQECDRFDESCKDGYAVRCDTCGAYFMGSPALFENEYASMPREKKAMISAYLRDLFECGKDRPELGDAELLEGIIKEYENKTVEQKLDNLLFVLRKRSKEFGAFVPVNEKRDYPITYSLGDQGFASILKLARDKGFLEEGATGIAGKLTEDGWRKGTEIMNIKLNL